MRKFIPSILSVVVVWSTAAATTTYSIPQEKLDSHRVYWGDPAAFGKAGEVDFDALLRETDEYREIKQKKVERGTGKYWILLSKASERALRAMAQYGQDSEYDLLTAMDYLNEVEPAIPVDDITDDVIAAMNGESKKSDANN